MTKHKIALRKANVEVVAHLRDVLLETRDFGLEKTSRDHLILMCTLLLSDGIADFPPDKSGRWIGYIQGVMSANGILDVEAERARTRKLYQKAYNV